MSTTIAYPPPRVASTAPGWALETHDLSGLISYLRSASRTVVAVPESADEAPYPVRLELVEYYDDEGYVEGPFINLSVNVVGSAAAFTIDQARDLRAALTELITAYEFGVAFPPARPAVSL